MLFNRPLSFNFFILRHRVDLLMPNSVAVKLLFQLLRTSASKIIFDSISGKVQLLLKAREALAFFLEMGRQVPGKD